MTNENRRILLVEDNEIAQTSTLILLEHLGYQIDTATTGKQALAMLHEQAYDLILLDIGLPDMDGFKVAELMLEHSKESVANRIVVLTAHSDEVYRKRCKEVGVAAFWVKPVSSLKVKEFLNHSQVWFA
jgi:CheY-like chemotaxis protein